MSAFQTEMRSNPELEALRKAASEARRFIEKADKLFPLINVEAYVFHCPARAAAKRASLDLTRALAEFRKVRI